MHSSALGMSFEQKLNLTVQELRNKIEAKENKALRNNEAYQRTHLKTAQSVLSKRVVANQKDDINKGLID